MSNKLPILLPILECANVQRKTSTLRRNSFFNNPSGRFVYQFSGLDTIENIFVYDTRNETTISLQPSKNSLLKLVASWEFPFFLDDYTIIQFFRYRDSPDFSDYTVTFDLENRTFEAKSLGVNNLLTNIAAFPIAIESDWLLFAADIQQETDRLYWVNTKTLELKQFRSSGLLIEKEATGIIFYKNHILYVLHYSNKKIRQYDLNSHLPWLSTFDVEKIPFCEVKVKGPLKLSHSFQLSTSLKQNDKIILNSYKTGHIRILDLNTGLFKGFKLPSPNPLYPNIRKSLFKVFEFNDNLLTIDFGNGVRCGESDWILELKFSRFALRKPERLFNLAWFQRPRDFPVPTFMKQLL